jgi:hypothetical protein
MPKSDTPKKSWIPVLIEEEEESTAAQELCNYLNKNGIAPGEVIVIEADDPSGMNELVDRFQHARRISIAVYRLPT